jgi:hypothetical protein
MPRYICVEMLDSLQNDVRQMILEANYLKSIDPAILLQEPAPAKWSVIQVLEHLNSYGRYYLLAIERSMNKNTETVEYFKPGWIGDYFTKLMKPGENGQISNKMKSPKDHRPSKFPDVFPVLNTFLEQQQYLLDLLELAKSKNIGAIRTPISISRFIKLKLGDTFRFFVAHEQRHFVQINNALAINPGVKDIFPTAHPVV